MAAAPITRELLGNTFTFTTDCFSVTSSGGNVHRRHSPSELRDHFDSGEDRPAHWYEAQLRHYQLPPSKVKSTAKLRLLEAVRRGDLVVPGEFAKLERDMRREWTRASKAGAGAAKSSAGQKKRKAAAEDDYGGDGGAESFHATVAGAGGRAVSVNIGSAASSSAPAKKPAAAKKGKAEPKTATTPAAKKVKTEAKATTTSDTKKVQPGPKATTAPAAKKIKTESKADITPAAKKKAAPKKSAAVLSPHPADVKFPLQPAADGSQNGNFDSSRKGTLGRVINFGRRGTICRPEAAGKQPHAAGTQDKSDCSLDEDSSDDDEDSQNEGYDSFESHDGYDGYDDEPDNEGYDEDDDDDERDNEGCHDDDDDDDDDDDPPTHHTPALPDRTPRFGARQTMTLTLDGDALWMRFDLGFLEGVGRTAKRPYETSRRRTFGWFGYSTYYHEAFTGGGGGGPMDARLEFVGGGVVRGEVEWVNRQWTCFEARRLDGQGTRSNISAREMRDRFEGFRDGYV
ncbi:hypothetical protein MGG_09233 [Pyricularia oryzae 70-15]|uniref:Uncharacterized protein n=1 Tax=Pyricularia oryzae (strain 70-15 / ATCC MYA-4617 / FGSC 8958) TaxID=242507 RepID=G4MPU6_PYRO7|nr:uncharacterized protein MGG_09233 [Pyricularia oryzae 70-15]EHA57243.1 hypothetical protein MGG_09233 [Pyricularia oryzae 70-15]